jgi:hypothetical protein
MIKLVRVAAGLAFLTLPGWAETILYDFGNPIGGPVGAAQETIPGDPAGGPSLTAYGYTAANVPLNLYWKNAGTDEHGLGFVGTLDNEETLNAAGTAYANYVEIGVGPILSYTNPQIRIQSVTESESWDLWGTNTLGNDSTFVLLLSSQTADNTFVSLPDWGTYKYYAVTVHPDSSSASNNILFDSIEANGVTPEPGTLSMMAGGIMLALVLRVKARRIQG